MMGLGHGGSKVRPSGIGNILAQALSYGFMESVSVSHFHVLPESHSCQPSSRCRKEHSFVCTSFHIHIGETYDVPSPSSSIIEDILEMYTAGLASIAFFYCDFRDDQKKGLRGLVSSLLVQLCDQTDGFYRVLSDFYKAHRGGEQQASDNKLLECLTQMLELKEQPTVYIIIDALDECPRTSSIPSPRDEVLDLVEELVSSRLLNLRICVTSRPEADISPILDPLVFRSISIHGEHGQLQDIAEYIKSVVNTDREMRRWKARDRELVIDALTEKSDGM
jgi:hypothetical protein